VLYRTFNHNPIPTLVSSSVRSVSLIVRCVIKLPITYHVGIKDSIMFCLGRTYICTYRTMTTTSKRPEQRRRLIINYFFFIFTVMLAFTVNKDVYIIPRSFEKFLNKLQRWLTDWLLTNCTYSTICICICIQTNIGKLYSQARLYMFILQYCLVTIHIFLFILTFILSQLY